MIKKVTTLFLAVILLFAFAGKRVDAEETSYRLRDDTQHGSLKFFVEGEQVTSAKEGDTVVVQVNKDNGYDLLGVECYYNSICYRATEDEDTYSFTMPASMVAVEAILYKSTLHVGENSIAQDGVDNQYYIFTPDKDNTYIFTVKTDSETSYNQYYAYISFYEVKDETYDELTRQNGMSITFSLDLKKDHTYFMYMYFLGYASETKHVDIKIAYGKYHVDFDSEGGSPVASQDNPMGSVITIPEEPIKDGYEFVGWYERINVGGNAEFIKYDFSVSENEDKTLYAKWVLSNHADDKYGSDVVVAEASAADFTDMDNYSDKTLVLEADNGIVIIAPNVHHSGHIWQMNSDYQPKVEGLEAFVDKAVEASLTEFYLEIAKTDANEDIAEDCEENRYEVVDGSFFDAHMMMSMQNGYPGRYPSDLGLLTDVPLTITLDLSSEGLRFPAEKSGYKRFYYVAHYNGTETEYLPLTLDANKEKGTFTTTSLSPFAIVYKDVKDIYIVPNTCTK